MAPANATAKGEPTTQRAYIAISANAARMRDLLVKRHSISVPPTFRGTNGALP